MFTGIVEATGTVEEVRAVGGGLRVTIEAPEVVHGLGVGDSVAVRGACLTAVEVDADSFTVELVTETVNRTVLGQLEAGARVNLERAMAASGRFDGHIVQGHVDGIGTVASVTPEGDSRRVQIQSSPEVLRYVVEKGSITVDGVSLTVAGVSDGAFEVVLIPHTLAATTLGVLEAGTRVNLEADILAKYVDRLLEARH